MASSKATPFAVKTQEVTKAYQLHHVQQHSFHWAAPAGFATRAEFGGSSQLIAQSSLLVRSVNNTYHTTWYCTSTNAILRVVPMSRGFLSFRVGAVQNLARLTSKFLQKTRSSKNTGGSNSPNPHHAHVITHPSPWPFAPTPGTARSRQTRPP